MGVQLLEPKYELKTGVDPWTCISEEKGVPVKFGEKEVCFSPVDERKQRRPLDVTKIEEMNITQGAGGKVAALTESEKLEL
ncbi:hypothetical protein AKJ57_04095 [candidate division MSBL1 archaeon SCGC-AAA259A05]|uniref:Uncharacterized protein n=1 Tax=candidate division MSBL1 archaeon SCGC-AAA259A05 TaxID=1698259 RepID=A0A133U8J2_9EURY|nr:hypothetical protein AKJ57_04095 [candidate division MSBL1 archaeon SCGC-AAA259A05]